MNSWQDLLAIPPDQLGWGWSAVWGVMGLVASMVMFLTMILHHPFSALLVSRVILGLGLLLLGLKMLQPGWGPYVDACYAVGGLLSSLLIATGWCNREDQSVPMWRAVLRWTLGRAGAALSYMAGGVDHSRREDAL